MLLLAVDTSGKQGSIALARCAPEGACDVIEVVPLSGGTFSAQLVPEIAALLAKHSLGKNEIDGFAVVSGPGSFTGLRIGLAVIKALAEATGKPIAAVSLLEAVVSASGARGNVTAVLDAGRNEVFLAEYQVANLQTRLLREELVPRSGWLESAPGPDSIIVTPDEVIAQAADSKGLPVKEIERPQSDAVARLGWKKILAGETISAEDLDANYLRRSDQELFSKN